MISMQQQFSWYIMMTMPVIARVSIFSLKFKPWMHTCGFIFICDVLSGILGTKNIFHVHRFISNVCIVSFKFVNVRVCICVCMCILSLCVFYQFNFAKQFDIEMKNNNYSKLWAIDEHKTTINRTYKL